MIWKILVELSFGVKFEKQQQGLGMWSLVTSECVSRLATIPLKNWVCRKFAAKRPFSAIRPSGSLNWLFGKTSIHVHFMMVIVYVNSQICLRTV